MAGDGAGCSGVGPSRWLRADSNVDSNGPDLTAALTATQANRSEAWRYPLRSDLGADGEIRTPDQRFTKPLLYH